jgi:hypothetical protein
MRTVDAVRLGALRVLLSRPDERALHGRRGEVVTHRGHRVTQPGKSDRLTTTWLSFVDVWTAERIAESIGPIEGWKFQWRRHAAIGPAVPQWSHR